MKIPNLSVQLQYLKDNLSIIILIPTVIGGLWQLLELSIISTSFIRFFSISQLVADGILILFIISIMYTTFMISSKIVKRNDFQFDRNKKATSIWLSIVIIVFSILIFLFIPFPILKEIYRRQSIKIFEIILLVPIMTIIVGTFLLGFLGVIENLISKFPDMTYKLLIKLKHNKKFKENFVSILSFAIVLISLFSIKFILVDMNPYISSFRQYIVFPENLMNKEILDKKIIDEYHLKYKPILIYNNDKYFFYKVYDDKKNEKILIIDYNKLTEK